MASSLWIDTAVGPCELSFSQQGLTSIALPQPTERETRQLRELIVAGARAKVPGFVRKAAVLLARQLAGKPQDLSGLVLDLTAQPAFRRRVYEAARAIASGSTTTYGDLARTLGAPGAARAVGQALAKNPLLIAVPCHRVLGARGKPGGFSAPGGTAQKERLLRLEGVELLGAGAAREVPASPGFAFDAAKVVRALSRKDPALGRAMRLVGPFQMQPPSMSSPFEALARSIVYQQLTGKAAATILSRVVALFEPPFPRPQDLIAARDETLRSAGLSRNKTAALKDLAEQTLAGVVPGFSELAAMEEEAIIERLTAVRGIGRWTVEMLLMFRLGRPDVLPATDYGVRKGFARAHGLAALPSPKELLAHGERWRPWRTVASWYLWRVAELPDELLPALRR
jgi:methylated-DNA-[protein]-cysteine S-methyltransferase